MSPIEPAQPEPSSASVPRRQTIATMTLLGRLMGAIGLIVWLSTPLTYLLTGMSAWVVLKVFLGTLLVALYLATNRDFFSRLRHVRAGGLLVLSGSTVTLVFALLVGLNVFAYTHNRDFDVTHEGIYTLSPQTLGVLHRLDTEVTVFAFFGSQEPAFAPVEETLLRYAHESPHLSTQMIDPAARPDLVKKYGITDRGPRVVVTALGTDARAKNLSEEELTNALVQVVGRTQKTVRFLAGHTEGDIENEKDPEGFKLLAQAIETDGYKIETLNLQAGAPPSGTDAHLPHGSSAQNLESEEAAPLEVPADTSVLVMVAPSHRLLAPEVAAISAFVQRGGRLLALEGQTDSGLGDLYRAWGVQVRDDLIVDTNPMGRLLGLGVASPILVPLDDGHTITRGISSVVMTTARSVIRATEAPTTQLTVPLLQSGPSAWGETQLHTGGALAKDDKDHMPPLYTAMAAYASDTEDPAQAHSHVAARGRLVVFGDEDWASNRLIGLQSNEDLLLNALAWLAEEPDHITIRPKTRAQSTLQLSQAQLSTLKFATMDILPVLLVALGLGIGLIRRQR